MAVSFHGQAIARTGASARGKPRFNLDMCTRNPVKIVTTPATNNPAAQPRSAASAALKAVNSLWNKPALIGITPMQGCKNNTECDALLINTNSRTDTYPAISVRGDRNATQHEASVSKVSEDMIFYMQSRGLTEAQAMSLAVNGFINDLARQFPMEYSVELKRLIDLEMEGSVG